ncbi:VOC family protein [Actinacidiphila soli]|uniref:VOC family protein n=1 Tax=Actinacidiphila soli TaxID=2487275 RepID=UPI000FCBADEB|nr:VOC family protein [Actinacidiphila soli]
MTYEMPRLAGVHHIKLPVRDLARSEAWYGRVLGYHRVAEFIEEGALKGLALDHPAGGPHLGLRQDPARAEAAAGFDYFAIGVPDEAAIEALAARLDDLGERHGEVIRTRVGWILPLLHDPDGHEVRFYTIAEHTPRDPGHVMRVEDGRKLIDASARRTPPSHR